MELLFEWDARKADANHRKHGVSFIEAQSVFGDQEALYQEDPDHSVHQEERWLLLGQSERRRILVIVHCERQGRIRIISARKASLTERRQYEERR